jgi:hypothetical protein
MLIRKTLLRPEEQRYYDDHLAGLSRRLLDQVARILAHIGARELRELSYRLAFKPNAILPKRLNRPQLTLAHVTEQLYDVYAPNDAHRGALLQLSILVLEYYDMLDDLVDGDVAAGHELEVVLVSQLLMPLIMRSLGELGPAAINHWTMRCLDMVESLYLEKRRPKSWDAYLRSLEKQAHGFGFVTALPAIVNDRPNSEILRAERIGQLAYLYSQLYLDLQQRDRDDESNWNAAHFRTQEEIVTLMAEHQRGIFELTEPFPAMARMLIRGTFALDLRDFSESLAAE